MRRYILILSFAVFSCGVLTPFTVALSQTTDDTTADITTTLGNRSAMTGTDVTNILGKQANADQLFSPSVGKAFYDLAYDLANAPDADEKQLQLAMILLKSNSQLDEWTQSIAPKMITIASKQLNVENSHLVYALLKSYLSQSCDLEITRQAVSYLLSQQNTRQQCEQLLQIILGNLASINNTFDSQIYTQMAMLSIEKSDANSAISYFIGAYNLDKYNSIAFNGIYNLSPDVILPSVHLENMRLAISQDPYSLEKAITFAQYAEQLQLYSVAAGAYKYCADLFEYLYHNEPLPESIYLPWTMSAFNTNQEQYKCLDIVRMLRAKNQFDMLAEVIAAKVSKKQQQDDSETILRDAETRLLADWRNPSVNVPDEQMAWFYTFALRDVDKALDYANKAYSQDVNSVAASSILAYLLVENDQVELAESIIKGSEKNQIAEITQAKIFLKQDKKEEAIALLKESIEKNHGTLESSLAKEILVANGSEYISPFDTKAFLVAVQGSFENTVIPEFSTPDKRISLQFSLKGNKFAYDQDFAGQLVITNKSVEPFKINDNCMIKGNIRIDAKITGDIEKTIPELITMKTTPSEIVGPDRSFVINLNMVSGELKKTLMAHPQASLDITFTAYIDPVEDKNGLIVNRLTNIKPAEITVKRPAVELSPDFLQNRFSSLARGKQGQKINICRLFIGLLMEQQAMANRPPMYKYMYGEWMPKMLKSAIISNLTSDDWIVRTNSLAAICDLKLDYQLMDVVSGNLNETHWPTRMMALMILKNASGQKFDTVLDWTAKHDPNPMVREMAIALGAAKQQEPAPEQNIIEDPSLVKPEEPVTIKTEEPMPIKPEESITIKPEQPMPIESEESVEKTEE